MALTEESASPERARRLLAPLGVQTYGNLCEPANGRNRQTGILRIDSNEVRVPDALNPEESTEGSQTMNVVVAIIIAVALAWIVFVAYLIATSAS